VNTKPLTFILAFTFMFLVSLFTVVFANNLQDGLDAFERKDYETAYKLLAPFAEQGDAYAQFNLGQMYRQGKGVLQNNKNAFKWWKLSAEQGVAQAQYNLGRVYYKGRGVTKDYKEAVKWYSLSAEQGFAEAQLSLGFMYVKGHGVSQDYVLAHMWWNLAGSSGNKGASKNKKRVGKIMSPQQIEKAQEMARDWEPTIANSQSTQLADHYWNKAKTLEESEKYIEAAEMYIKSAEAEQTSPKPRMTDLGMEFYFAGSMYFKTFQYDKAIEYLQQALVINRKLGNEKVLFMTLISIGETYDSLGQYDKAIEYLQQALPISKKLAVTKDSKKVGRGKKLTSNILNTIGMAYSSLGQYNKAIEYLQQALTISRELGNEVDITALLNSIGVVFKLWGQYDKAIDYFQQVLDFNRKLGNEKWITTSLDSIGGVFLIWGQYNKAVDYFQQALDLSIKLGNEKGIATSLNSVGSTYSSLGQYDKAIEYLQQALTANRKLGNEEGIAGNLSNIGMVYSSLGQHNKALEYFQQALDRSKKLLGETKDSQKVVSRKYTLASTLNNIGGTYSFLGQPSKAIEYYQQALTANRKLGNEEGIAGNLSNIGIQYYEQKQYDLSINHLEESVELIEKIRKTATGDVRRDYLASQIETYKGLIASYLMNGQVNKAFVTMELSRAKLLAERIAGSKDNNAIPSLSQVQQALKETMAVLAYANSDGEKTVQIAITSKTTNGQMVAGEPFWDTALKKYDSAVNTLLGKQRGIKIVGTNKEKPHIDKAKKNDALEKLINFYRSLLTNTLPENEQPRREIARALYDFLIKPMLPQIQGKKDLIIIPDGVLGFLPFETLIDEEGKYLIESYNITYAQSMGVMQLINNRTYKEDRKPFLAFGGAVYDEITYETDMIENTAQLDALKKNITLAMANTRSVTEAYASLGIAQMSNLPGTLSEVKALAGIVPGTDMLTGEKVSEDEVKSLSASGKLAEYKVIHFATHGVVVPEFPELSALVLSQFKDKSGKEDGFLRMGEIAKLKLNADFVNLSACETGLGKIYGGEGVVGLTQSFLIAGANGLSVSLWQVDDQSTMMFMVGVYQLVEQKGMSYSQAINEMKRTFIRGQVSMDTFEPSRGITVASLDKAKSGKLSHPFYWGPFVYYGRN
jgi:tetratricopeptide (TPR) repeat protein